MVPQPITVERWQPVSLLRQRMLDHSFTYIPVTPSGEGDPWVLVSDHQLARYVGDREGRLDRLAEPLSDVLGADLDCTVARSIDAQEPVTTARVKMEDRPFLVMSEERLVGIITAFDLL